MVGPHVAALDTMWTVYPGSSLAQRRISYGDAPTGRVCGETGHRELFGSGEW